MKKKAQIITLMLLLATAFSHAQQNQKNQVNKKDIKKGLVSFNSSTDENGAVSFGFTMNGASVGPNMVLHPNGKTTYVSYNKDHQMDGTMIIMKKQEGTVELYTYRNNKKNGPSFKMVNGKPTSPEQYKNDRIDANGFVVDPPGEYVRVKGDGLTGFTMEKYDNNSYAIGYFKYGYRYSPMIHVWDNEDVYYGQYLGGSRNGFGVYFHNNGKKYAGDWNENYKEGLGFTVDKEGNLIEKGYYEGGVLKIPL